MITIGMIDSCTTAIRNNPELAEQLAKAAHLIRCSSDSRAGPTDSIDYHRACCRSEETGILEELVSGRPASEVIAERVTKQDALYDLTRDPVIAALGVKPQGREPVWVCPVCQYGDRCGDPSPRNGRIYGRITRSVPCGCGLDIDGLFGQ